MKENIANHYAKRLCELMDEHKLTQSAVAKGIDMSPTAVSQFIANKYKGDIEKICQKVNAYINAITKKKARNKEIGYIETEVAIKIKTVIEHCIGFSKDEGTIGIITGDAGHGKSCCLQAYAESNPNAVYLQLHNRMTSQKLMSLIAEAFGEVGTGRVDKICDNLADALQDRESVLILDEASSLDVQKLSLLREVIVTLGRTPLVLAGNKNLLNTIRNSRKSRGYECMDQFRSRMFAALDLDEIASSGGGGGQSDTLYNYEEIRKLYTYGGIRLARDAVIALHKICCTPNSGRLRSCRYIVQALHSSSVIEEAKVITKDNIFAAIQQLALPIFVNLPIPLARLKDQINREVEDQNNNVAMTA